MISFSFTPISTKKIVIIHATKNNYLLCNNKIADNNRGTFSNMQVTCKRCLAKMNITNETGIKKKIKNK